ncbi:MAG: lysophospholipase [Actinomycetota bacterium]|nr:lysophospholipase [Actinomycetota bacterium]
MRTEGTFTGTAGGQIHWRRWATEAPKAQVVIVHGYGEHGDRYARLAGRLVEGDFSVWANDHRGHGLSEGPRGLLMRLGDAVGDVDRIVEMARAAQPGLPVFMFAHSMGGTIGLQYAIEHQDKLAGLVLSSAAVSRAGLDVPRVQHVIVKLFSRIAPKLPVNRLALEGISRDPEEARIYREDPLVHKGAQPARTVVELLDAMERLPARAGELSIPLLVIAGSADPIVPDAGSREIAERAGSEDKQIIVYDGHVHELINEPLEDRERVTRDVIEWLQARVSDPG